MKMFSQTLQRDISVNEIQDVFPHVHFIKSKRIFVGFYNLYEASIRYI